MCDDVPNFQRCDGYDAPLNTRPYALFDSSSDDPAPSPQLSSISSQIELSGFDSFDEVPPPRSFPGQSFSIRRVPVTHRQLGKGKATKWGPPLHQSILFTDGSCPGGVSAASAHSTYGRELEGSSPSATPDVPQIRVIPPCDPDRLLPYPRGDLVPTSPDYFNYVWTLAIFDGGYPFDGKTEEQNSRIRVLSEVYRGTDIALDCVPELLNKTCICPSDSVGESIDQLLADLTSPRTSATPFITEKSITTFKKPKSELVMAKILQQQQDQQWIEEAEPDPWSQEPIEFTADDGYSKKRDASFSETARFLSETVPSAASAFHWRSFLDAAAWNKANHSLHNAVNATTPLLPTTFHPVVVDSMLQIYLAGRTPVPLSHPLYEYACYDCCHLRHWSCHNGRGSRWTPTTDLSAKDKNEGPCCSTTRSLRSTRCRSPTPGPSVNPGRSGVR
ncbi:hypothetical protein PISMIDRAFT_17165 [Pisolithus microcarpus 441]|uniref:Uncharacterized protein n=1 Tax=Pisolithus microcarpus 441 TaxID=765257 RepID=A0A0C9YD84_9AGAM|nr:hypothetical protein PISMIDRAFT_17165 [Pisolithus microcarpus 441]